MKTQPLSVDLLRSDDTTRSRLNISDETVDDYQEIIEHSDGTWPFEPLDVFQDGSEYCVGEGAHRLLAARAAKRASVPCRVHKGTADDARIFGMTANDKHGLRISRADRRANVEWLLDNRPKMTQKDLAEKAGVTTRTVKAVVADRTPTSTSRGKKGNFPFDPPDAPESDDPFGDDTDPFGDDTPSEPPEPPQDASEDDGAVDTPTEPETPQTRPQKSKGREAVSTARLVDALTKQHIGHVARGLTNIAEANGGEGAQFKAADAGLNQLIRALQEMRKGKQ